MTNRAGFEAHPSAPTLTVAIPTYQRPKLLERALASVLMNAAGHASDLEILVSDNSLDDTSAATVRRLGVRWPGAIHYHHNRPSVSMIENFNLCIARATGHFILILHDDDFLLHGAIANILDGIRSAATQDRVLLFGVEVVDGQGDLLRRQEFRRERFLGRQAAVARVLSRSSFVRFPAIVIRRDAFDDVGAFDATVGNPTDLDLWIRLFATFGVLCLPRTVSAYSVHEEAATSSMFNPGTILTLAEIFRKATSIGVLAPGAVKRHEADWFHQFILAGAYRRLRAGEPAAARTVLRLFAMPQIRRLGWSRRWLLVRIAMTVLTRLPTRVALRSVRMMARLDPDHRFIPSQ